MTKPLRNQAFRGTFCVLVASLAASCGGGQTQGAPFDPRWSDDGGAAMAALQQRLASAPLPRGADVAVGVVDKGTLVGAPLDGGAPWTFKHALDQRPSVAGSVVVGLGGGELFALDARSGRLLWKREAGGLLRGAGDDGKTTAVSLMSSTLRGTTVLAIARDGSVLRQLEDANEAIGVPAVAGGLVFLPWQKQYVSAFDVEQGSEKARTILRHQTSHVFVTGGAMFFGETSATRLDGQIRLSGADKASTVTLPKRELPGDPRWRGSGNEPLPVAAGATDRIRLYARPTASGPAGFEGDRYVGTYLKLAVGFDAKDASLAWVHAGDAPYIGGAAYAGGFALCDASGKVRLLDAKSGAVQGEVSLGKALLSCVVQADALTKPAASGEPLPVQLAKAVAMRDAEHGTMQRVLLAELTKLPDESVTQALLDLATDARTPPELLELSRAAIAKRTNGIEPMLAALDKRYDYLAGTLVAPPVGPIADALGASGEKRAAPLLARHLLDPSTVALDVPRAAAALDKLAGPAERPALETFFAHYRCVANDEALVPAVASVASALMRLGARDIVLRGAKDPFTTAEVKGRLEALVKAAPAGRKP
jgi:outer membrane protein assembly factor BamB